MAMLAEHGLGRKTPSSFAGFGSLNPPLAVTPLVPSKATPGVAALRAVRGSDPKSR
jgi:hypothetical protein